MRILWIYLCIQLELVNAIVNRYPVMIVMGTVRTQNGYGWPIDELRKLVRVKCLVHHSIFILTTIIKPNDFYIENCKISKTPFKDLLQSYQIDFTKLDKLQFVNTFMDTPYPKGYTAGLPLRSMEMTNLTNFHVTEDFFSLTTLRELKFTDTEVPVLPPSKILQLESLVLRNSPLKKWYNCEYLQYLVIEHVLKEHIPTWPTNCTQLKILRIQSMPLEAAYHITKNMNASTVDNLEILSINNCSLKQLPLYLMKSQTLKEIYLSDNNINDDAISQFPSLTNLEVLGMPNNDNINSNIPGVLSRVPGLRELNLDGTGTYSWEDSFSVREALTKLTSLSKLQLRFQFAFDDVFMHSHFKNLTHLTMINHYIDVNTWKHLRLHSFPSTGAQQLEVDVRGIPVKHVSIGPEYAEDFESIPSSRFWLTNKGYKLIVRLDSVDCECNNHILARALREYPHFLAMPDLKCHHGGPFLDEPVANLNCRMAYVNGCVRRMSRERNYTTIVDCSRNTQQFRWPLPRGFQGFNASSNGITSLDKAYLPDTLEWLDLRNNSISRLNGEQTMQLFGNKGRRVWLAGNHIVCDCDNQALLDALHVNQSLVMDYDNLTCADSGKPLRLVFVAELCRPRLVMVSVSVSLLAVLLLIAALLVRHYWISLRMILYAHGCCISCLRKEDLDQDRPYDAFLSFAHGDDDYVMQKLLPQLEGEPNSYKICVHYRDWSVGEWIPAQIMQSVRLSKRTIIVLSKNFVKSCWGVLEFRHANAGATADGRKRLLVLVLDDVLSETLTPELQGYLELNTYLDCKDPWFWEKLRYAMPHKDSKEQGMKDSRNLDSQTSAHRHFNNMAYSEETLSMPEIHSIETLHDEEVPSRQLNVVISSE